jgi:hypothetical protein
MWPFGKWVEVSQQKATVTYVLPRTGHTYDTHYIVTVEQHTRTGKKRAFKTDAQNNKTPVHMGFVE